jgi:DNA polymerase III subunit delta'
MLTNVLGQESVVAALKQSVRTGRLSSTYLFTGEHQIGKTTTAIAFAKVLLCEIRGTCGAESCDACPSCRMLDAWSHPDVRIVAPAGPSRILRMAQFWPRDNVKDHPADKAMLRDLHFAPVSGKKRVFIVESAETMNEDTANSLLKVLEEPPPYAVFVLTTVSPEAILPTIFSRSQSLRFRPVPEAVLRAELIRRGVPEPKATFLAGYAQGRPGVAFRAASTSSGLKARDEILEIAAESSSGKSVIAAFRIADDFRKASAKLTETVANEEEPSPRILLTGACDLLLFWYRDLLVRRSTKYSGRVLNSDRLVSIDSHSKRYTVDELEKAIALVQDTRRYIGRNANAQIATEYLMMNLLLLGKNIGQAA